MFDFITDLFRKEIPEVDTCEVEAPPEVMTEVEEIRQQRMDAKTKSDRIEIELDQAHENHRATQCEANATYAGLTNIGMDSKEMAVMKAKWLKQNEEGSGAVQA